MKEKPCGHPDLNATERRAVTLFAIGLGFIIGSIAATVDPLVETILGGALLIISGKWAYDAAKEKEENSPGKIS